MHRGAESDKTDASAVHCGGKAVVKPEEELFMTLHDVYSMILYDISLFPHMQEQTFDFNQA